MADLVVEIITKQVKQMLAKQERGLNLGLIRTFILKHHGEGGMEKLRPYLTPGLQEKLESKIAMSTSEEVITEYIKAMAKAFDSSEESISRALGSLNAEKNFGVIYRLVLALASPEKICQRLPQVFKNELGEGEVTEFQAGKNSCYGVIKGYRGAGVNCHGICGYIETALKLGGAKHVEIKHPQCEAKGDGQCRFEIKWD